jgi:5-methylcytosine-specific restriction endonuclease McrA
MSIDAQLCRMCGTESTWCLEYAAMHEEAQVCAQCAVIVANAYWKKHSGEWLTWPRDRAEPRGRVRKNISASVRTQVMERDMYRCVTCKSHISLQIDHIHPHSKGGSDEPDNLQTLCGPCNNRKHNKVEE